MWQQTAKIICIKLFGKGGGTERGNQFADTFGTGNHAQSYEKLSTHKL